jgi:tetratricopeptide (TPR) repeat protein
MTAPSKTGLGHSSAGERAVLSPGDRLGRWEIVEVLGRGGMGIVYRAESEGRTVALKAIHPHLLERREFLRRFHLEAEAGARIRHANVVRTFGVETHEGRSGPVHVLVMEYVRGRTLADLQLEHGRVPEGVLRDIAIQIASALCACHEAGVIHRDLKPENVLVTDAHEVKVMDLGVARLRHEDVRLSRTGQFVGSLLFAAPEQLGDKAGVVGPAADLYAFGLVLFHLAAGRHAFEAETVGEIVAAHLHTPAPTLRSVALEVSPFLSAVVATLLEKAQTARFPTARLLKETLEAGEASAWWRERRPSASSPAPGTAADPGAPPLLGRSRELRELADAWSRARRGAGSAVLLVGEEGVGKSRLLSAFVEAAGLPPCDALQAAPRGEAEAPFGAFRSALAGALPRGAALASEVARLVPERAAEAAAIAALLAEPSAPVPDAVRDAGAALADLAFGLARERPRVVVVDDLALAGEDDRALFRSLAAVVGEHAVLLVGAATAPLEPRWREELLETRGLREHVLSRLDAEAMRGVLRSLVGCPDTADALAADLLARAGGTPQVLERLVEGLKASGYLRVGTDGWRLVGDRAPADLPASVRDLVLRRLAALPAPSREALEGACVQGRSFDVRVVAAVLGRPVLAVLEDLVALTREPRLVRGEGRLRRFDPAVVQEVAWEGLDPARRSELHRRTADVFEALVAAGETDRARGIPRVAFHRLLGGDAAGAAPVLLGALDALLAAHRSDEALELTGLAVAAGTAVPADVRAGTLLRRARLLGLRGRRDEERSCLEQALAAAITERRAAPTELLEAYGRCLLAVGERRRAEETFREQLAAAEAAGDAVAQAAAQGILAHVAASGSDVATARARAERTLRLARATGQARLEASALGLLASAFERDGRPDLAAEHQARRLALATRTADASEASDAHGGLARLALRRGRWREAQVHLDRQGTTAGTIGYRLGEARARIGAGLLSAARGRLEEARAWYDEAMRLARAANAGSEEAEAGVHAARASLALGDAAGALALLLRALGIASRLQDDDTASLACLGAAAVAEDRGDGEEATAWYRDAAARGTGAAGGWAEVSALLGLARAARLTGRTERMTDPLDRAAHLARARRWPGPLVVAAAMRACLPGGDAAGAVALLAEHGEHLTWAERLETHLALHRATEDRWHLEEARAVLAGARAEAPSAPPASSGARAAKAGAA